MSDPIKDPVDDRLSRSVMDALWRSEPIRARDLRSLEVVARGGTVLLRGVVATEAHKYAAAQLARAVPGVVSVTNELLTDDNLERSIAVALALNSATRQHRIAVRVASGVASLYGAVPSAEIADGARAAAGAVNGVRQVESRLQVVPSGKNVVLAWQNSIEGRPVPLIPASDSTTQAESTSNSGRDMTQATPRPAGMEGTA